MSDLQLLFLVLALVYGWECACWLSRGSVLIRSWLGRRWRVAHPGAILGNQRGGFLFAPPLPPLGTLLSANQIPLSLSPEAVLGYVASSVNPAGRPAQTGKCICWSAIRKIEVRRKQVLVNGDLLLKVPSPMFAENVTQLLRRLSQATPGERAKLIEESFRAAFDTPRIEQRLGDFKSGTGSLRLATNSLFCYLFVLTPTAIWLAGFGRSWPVLLAVLLVLTATIAILFHRAHKRLYPAAEDERFTHSVIFLLSPATAIRARDALSRPLLEAFHPLAVAKVLCSAEAFKSLARSNWRDLSHPALPVCPIEDAAAQATECYSRELLRKTVADFLRRSELDPPSLLAPPTPADESSQAFCSRCLAQYATRDGVCADCGGLRLEAFPPD